jgi:phosphate:Na+ symporter
MGEESGPIVLLNIAGGVALLLWASRMVRTGIERAFGAALKWALSRSVSSAPRATLAGILIALALQSATATSMLAMSFVASGLLLATPALRLMLDADLGSALAVQVLSLDLSWLWPTLLLFGVVVFLGSEDRARRQFGRIVVGLALLLLSLQLIGHNGAALQSSELLDHVLSELRGETLFAFIPAGVFAWAVHSSVATVLLIASLAGAGALEGSLALVLLLGANAGAGFVPLILSLGKPSA